MADHPMLKVEFGSKLETKSTPSAVCIVDLMQSCYQNLNFSKRWADLAEDLSFILSLPFKMWDGRIMSLAGIGLC